MLVPTLPQATLDERHASRAALRLDAPPRCRLVSIVAALGREAAFEPGEVPGLRARRRAESRAPSRSSPRPRSSLGNQWWSAEASSYAIRMPLKPRRPSRPMDV